MKKYIQKLLLKCGYEVTKVKHNLIGQEQEYVEFIDLYKFCQPYTMTSIERMYALYKSVEYIVKNNIEGDFVECGVWRGGSSMLIAKTLQKFGDTERIIHLYDTFEGMSEPSEVDTKWTGVPAKELLQKTEKISETANIWCYASLQDVQSNMNSTGYPEKNLRYYKGKVEDTLTSNIPAKIALLRLDTDWYSSTAIELNALYPQLTQQGILIIDDYGDWQGARKAVDEYISMHKIPILLNRIDYTGRIAIKV